ncbi:unnamed protein product [marine sediment metagenome]|uniref:ERCC4 domain-containing protein n=1 Tax=marine sediment metagenome TaxID=412755 RepID=X1N5D8_9ZZZZ
MVAIERKEGTDFISSIMDNRLFQQLLRLKEAYETPIVILEGLNDRVFSNTGMKISSIYGALAFISYKLGISVIPTRNLEDTAIVIERIAFREQVKDDMPLLSRKSPQSMAPEDRRIYIIEGLIDIGPKKAQALIKKFKTPFKVFYAIKKTEITFTRTGKPKGIEGPLAELSGFGWKFVEKNKDIDSLPGSLRQALVEFRKSDFMKEVFGEETWKNFYYAKLEEFDAYRINVSQWERDRYVVKL